MQLSVHRDGDNYVLMASFLHPDGQREIYSALVPRDSEPHVFADIILLMGKSVYQQDGLCK